MGLRAKGALIAILSVILLAGCNGALWRPEVVQERASGLIRDEGGGATLGQSFRAAHNGLARIDLAIAVDERLPTTALVFRLWQLSLDSQPLREVELTPEKLNRKGYTSVVFEPVVDSAGKDYLLELAAPGAEAGQALAIFYAADDPYAQGSAFRRGQPLSGDLAFRAYAHQSFNAGQVWHDFAGRAAPDWGFLAFYLTLLTATIAGTLFAMRAR